MCFDNTALFHKHSNPHSGFPEVDSRMLEATADTTAVHSKRKRTRTAKAGLIFPVGRVKRKLRESRCAKRISACAPVYLAAVLEYLTAEILEAAGCVAMEQKRKRITPRHIQLGVRGKCISSVQLKTIWSQTSLSPLNMLHR